MELVKDLSIEPSGEETVVVRIVPATVVLLVIVLVATIVNLVLTLTQKQPGRDTASRFDSPILRGTRNRVAPHEPIPRPYGRYRFRPPLGAYSYTEVIGVDHYLRALFVVGYGPLEIDQADMRLGETPLSQFDGVEIEIRPGELTDPPITLYPNQVTQQDVNIQLVASAGDTGQPTGPHTLTTDDNTDEVGIELLFPEGIGNTTRKGERQALIQYFRIEVRTSPAGVWGDVPRSALRLSSMASITETWESVGQVKVQGTRVGLFPVGINFNLTPRGIFDVRITALNPLDGSFPLGEVQWRSLKSFRNEAPFTLKGVALVAMRIKASDQISGTIDDFSLIARSKLATFNGSIWTAPVETRNAAWIYADILRGSANPDPIDDSLIDGPRLKEWADMIDAHTTPDENGIPQLNPMYFDGVFDFRSTIYRALSDVAAMARGSPHMRDGLYSVVIDHDRTNDPPVQMITPRNIAKDSFVGRKVFIEEAEGYRVGFQNSAKDFGDDEIVVFSPGFDASTARIYEKLEWFGITDANRAVDETRFSIFSRRYRPEVFRFETDVENIAFERGDLVVFGHDVPLLGIAYGRISSVLHIPDPYPGVITQVTLDEECEFIFGTSYSVRIRRHQSILEVMDAVSVVNPTTLTSGPVKTTTIVFTTPIVFGDAPVVGDMVSFGEAGIETRRCIVKSISPQNDLRAVVELEDAADVIFQDLTDPIPEYDPGINRPSDLPPLAPRILSAAGDFTNILVVIQMVSAHARAVSGFEVQVRTHDTEVGEWMDVPGVSSGGVVTVVISGLELDRTYDVRVRAVGPLGLASEWVERTGIFHASHLIETDRFYIGGLHLDNASGNDLDLFYGADVKISWYFGATGPLEFGDPLSDEPASSPTAFSTTNRFEGYRVRVREATFDTVQQAWAPGPVIREDLIQQESYVYSYATNVQDGGPRRELFFEVEAQLSNFVSTTKRQLALNPAPALPQFISVSGLGNTINLKIAQGSADADWSGFLVWRSLDSGFAPERATLVFKGRIDEQLAIPAVPGQTYYLRYASYDVFSEDPAALNVSDEVIVAVQGSPGAVNEVADSLATRFDGNPFGPYALGDGTGPPGMFAFVRPGWKYVMMHQIRYDATVNGFLIIDWDNGFYENNTVSNQHDVVMSLGIYYTVGSTPQDKSAHIPLVILNGSFGFLYQVLPCPLPNPSDGSFPYIWPPVASSPPAATFPMTAMLEVVAGQSYYFYCWSFIRSFEGEFGINFNELYLVHDFLVLRQVLNAEEVI